MPERENNEEIPSDGSNISLKVLCAARLPPPARLRVLGAKVISGEKYSIGPYVVSAIIKRLIGL